MIRRRAGPALAALALAVAVGLAVWLGWCQNRAGQSLEVRLAAVQPALAPQQRHPCPGWEVMPRVLLVLGQSNAGNHGAEHEPPPDGGPPQLPVFAEGGCQFVGDPLPGGTGSHRSIWSALPQALARKGDMRPVVLALLAVESTRIADWTMAEGPLTRRLDGLLQQLSAAGLQPEAVLWQQGEADAMAGTRAEDYVARFGDLRTRLRSSGIRAPILVARSSRCRGADSRQIYAAYDHVLAKWPDVQRGADTDTLGGELRIADCHFSRMGLQRAADLWAEALLRPPTASR